MKICLMNNLFSPYARGGAEKVVLKMKEKYLQAGHEVFLITTKPKKEKLPINNSSSDKFKIYYLNSEYYNLGKKSIIYRLFWHLNNLADFKKYYACQKIIEQEKPDLVITHNLMGLGYMSAQAAKINNAKHYHFLHDIQLLHPSGLMFYKHEKIIESWLAKLYQLITKHLVNNPDLIMSPSRWLLTEHQKKDFFKNSKTEIISLAQLIVSPDQKNSEIKIDKINKNKTLVFLFAGQLEKHKGIIFLINTLKKYQHSDWILKIAGQGKLENKIKNLIVSNKHFHYLGLLNKAELEKEFQSADILIMPSLCYENSPTIILEAQAKGLKVLASNLGGIPEIMRAQDILFTPGSETDLLTKINSL